jgi:hypothetical protein
MGREAETSLIPTVLCFFDLFVFGTLKGIKVQRNADERIPRSTLIGVFVAPAIIMDGRFFVLWLAN